jgi:hypothetical protein
LSEVVVQVDEFHGLLWGSNDGGTGSQVLQFLLLLKVKVHEWDLLPKIGFSGITGNLTKATSGFFNTEKVLELNLVKVLELNLIKVHQSPWSIG